MKSVRYSLSIIVSSVFVTLATPQVWSLFHTMFLKKKSDWLIEPWYYTNIFFRICLLLFLSDLIRQVVLKRFFFVRTIVETVLLAIAWTNLHYWYYPYYGILTIGIGSIAAYLLALAGDIRQISLYEDKLAEPTRPANVAPRRG
jgi:hypothetical protein